MERSQSEKDSILSVPGWLERRLIRPPRYGNTQRAARVAARYTALLTSRPSESKDFISKLLQYTAWYGYAPLQLPERFLHDIALGYDEEDVCLRHRGGPWALPYGEAYILAVLTAHFRPLKVFEIGTFSGGATLIMAQHADPRCEVYTLDLPPADFRFPGLEGQPPEVQYAHLGERFRGTKWESKITQLHGDSLTFDFTRFEGQMDLVFVDGPHDYGHVSNDTVSALRLLSDRGTIIWDDCSSAYSDVVRVLEKLGDSIAVCRITGSRFALHSRSLL